MLPPTLHNLTTVDVTETADRVREPFLAALRQMQIDNDLEQDLIDIYIPLAATLSNNALRHDGPLLVGINGAQGSGKSTICRLLEVLLAHGFSQRAATLSIDDLYLTRAARSKLAVNVHPLLATRGVPGTHDIQLGLTLLTTLRQRQGQQLAIPVFDKAIDDRLPQAQWRTVEGPVDLILFEGWCVGAQAQTEEALQDPVNELERIEDPDLSWRRYVNQQLQADYSRLFAELDMLIMLKIPAMESILEWRGLQEQKLTAANQSRPAQKIMDPTELRRFIMHYERLTRAMLAEMPDRADLVLELNTRHQIDGVRLNTLAVTGGL